MNDNGSNQYGPAEFAKVASKFNSLWSQPLNELPLSEFLAIYSPAVEWFDHAFLIHRVGHAGIEMLRLRWLTSNQPLQSEIKAIHPRSNGVVLELIISGVFAKDLYTIKATGEPFTYRACFVIDISSKTGLIERVEEYYTKLWYQSVDVAYYRVDKSKESAIGLPPSS